MNTKQEVNMLSDEYLIKGITGLSRAMERHWVTGHYGAGVIAAYYFCRDNELDNVTEDAIKNQVDRLVSKHSQLFKPIPMTKSDANLLEDIPRALAANISKLRVQGHNVIFAMYAIKALKQMPEMITPEVIAGICRLIGAFDTKTTKDVLGIDVSDVTLEGDDTIPEYTNDKVMSEFTINEFLKFKNAYCKGARGEAGHLITHAQSLIQLSKLGYPELAQKGYDAHRLQAKNIRKIHDLDCQHERPAEPAAANPTKPAYWQTDLEEKDWIIGHVFKYSYQLYDLLKSVNDSNLREKAIEQMEFILMHI